MMMEYERVREALEQARSDALRVYELDKSKPSGAFASGRYDGLKQAIEIIDRLWDKG